MQTRGVTRWESDDSFVQGVHIEKIIESVDKLLYMYKASCTKIRSTVQVPQGYLTSNSKNASIFEIRAVFICDPGVIRTDLNTVFVF